MSARKPANRGASERRLSVLRNELLDAQTRLRREPGFALAVIFIGVPAAGRSQTINELLEWLDPKYVTVHAFGPPDREERERPHMYRYWRTLPARGRIAFYFAAWYSEYMGDALRRRTLGKREERLAKEISQLEAMLAADRRGPGLASGSV